MGDLIFVALVVAFFVLTVAYVRACERIVGRDTGMDRAVGAGPATAAGARDPSVGGP